jgi:CheY-like chemotaxis protein
MDINMPEMDGFETTRFIRKMPAPAGTTPIIALTADAMTGDKENCIEAGMNSYISKPFKLEEIQEVLESVFVKNNPNGKQGQGKTFATNA